MPDEIDYTGRPLDMDKMQQELRDRLAKRASEELERWSRKEDDPKAPLGRGLNQ